MQISEDKIDQVKNILSNIFPKFSAIYYSGSANYTNIPYPEPEDRKHFRVCNAEMFLRYFRFAIPEGDISDAEMRHILDLAKDHNAFGGRLVELANQKTPDGTTRARVFLKRFWDYIDKVPQGDIPSIVQTLVNASDELLKPEDEVSILTDVGNGFLIEQAISRLLYKYDDQDKLNKRYEILKQAISDGNALSIIVDLVGSLERQYNVEKDSQPVSREEPLVSKDHVLELKKIAIGKIWKSAESNVLLKTREFAYILKVLLEWNDKDRITEWVKNITIENEGLVIFIEKFLNKSRERKRPYRLDYEGLALFVDLPTIVGRIRILNEMEGITETQKIAIQQFIQEFEQRERGKRSMSSVDVKSMES